MRALTIRQPWAWAIIHGGKDIENRTRNIAGSYRGPVAIHAGLVAYEQNNLASQTHRAAHGTEVDTEIAFGAFIGVADLVDVHLASGYWRWTGTNGADEWLRGCCESPWAQCQPADHHELVHLELANPRPLPEPIAGRGRLGLWTPSADVLERLQAVVV